MRCSVLDMGTANSKPCSSPSQRHRSTSEAATTFRVTLKWTFCKKAMGRDGGPVTHRRRQGRLFKGSDTVVESLSVSES